MDVLFVESLRGQVFSASTRWAAGLFEAPTSCQKGNGPWCHVGFGDPMPVTMVFSFVTFGGSWTKALKLLSFAEVDATGQVFTNSFVSAVRLRWFALICWGLWLGLCACELGGAVRPALHLLGLYYPNSQQWATSGNWISLDLCCISAMHFSFLPGQAELELARLCQLQTRASKVQRKMRCVRSRCSFWLFCWTSTAEVVWLRSAGSS